VLRSKRKPGPLPLRLGVDDDVLSCAFQLAKTRREAVATIRPREEKKEAPLHAAGEVLKMGEDPQNNTAAQRAWLYGEDAGIKTMTRVRDR